MMVSLVVCRLHTSEKSRLSNSYQFLSVDLLLFIFLLDFNVKMISFFFFFFRGRGSFFFNSSLVLIGFGNLYSFLRSTTKTKIIERKLLAFGIHNYRFTVVFVGFIFAVVFLQRKIGKEKSNGF